jgi:transcriptional regulator with XRE-family HTH domain
MVNNASFAKRLQKICDEFELSAAAFAEKVSVGRATISHILSGRNKPSLDFVMKVTTTFPEVDLDWLLYGRGTFPKTAQSVIEEIQSPSSSSSTITKKEHSNEIKQTPSDTGSQNKEVIEKIIDKPSSTQKIKRVLIFFEDGHFESYEA